VLKEALELIQTTAQKSVRLYSVPIPGDPRRAIIAGAGAAKEFTIPPPVRRHRAFSLRSLIRYATRLADGPGAPVIWHGPQAVWLILDDQDRLDTVLFSLSYSRPFLCLMELDAGMRPAMQQLDLIRLLRLDLGLPAEVVAPFRRLEWSHAGRLEWSHAANQSDHQQPRAASLGKTITATVATSGKADLPDALDVPVEVYESGQRARVTIRCLLEIDPLSPKLIEMVPAPGEIQAAIEGAQNAISQELHAEFAHNSPDGSPAIPIYYGDPHATDQHPSSPRIDPCNSFDAAPGV
jgi:hypothetical protein